MTLSISVENCTDFLPDIVKVESLSAKRTVFSELYGVYKVNMNLSAKQLSLAFEIRISFNIFISV